VKIGANSKYHKDIFKDILTLGILEFIRIERVHQKFRKLSIKEVHHEINKIIKNKKYKSISYYIDFFS